MVQLRALIGRLMAVVVLTLCLGGCVDYQLGIQFDSQTHGVLTQTIHLDERFVALNSEAQQQWLQVFIQEAKAFSGEVTSLEDGTLQVRIDFYNGADLTHKFNQLFAKDGLITQVPGSPPLLAHMNLTQQNWGVALQNQLHTDIDLSALAADSAIGEGGALDHWRMLGLSFQITSPLLPLPWDSVQTPTEWTLQPGQLNTIDATFWIPSSIGIGAVIIGLLCLSGYGLRYGLMGSKLYQNYTFNK